MVEAFNPEIIERKVKPGIKIVNLKAFSGMSWD